MEVSVILIGYHGDDWLPTCVKSLIGASERELHLVLVDNAYNTVIEDLDLSAFDAEVLSTPHPMGFAEANNFALVEASHLGDAILFLNQDTVGRAGWIDRCLECFAQSQQLGAVSPMIRAFDWSSWDPDFLAFVRHSQQEEHLERHPEEEVSWFEVKNAPAASLVVRMDVLKKTGPFDPVFGSYCEDMDLCRRIRRLGYKVGFCTTAELAHYNGSTTTSRAKELKRMRQILRNRVLYQLRASDAPYAPQLLRRLVVDLPRRLARGILATPSSQPPSVTLKAYGDLVRIAGRVVSRQVDERAWRQYLDEIGWPPQVLVSETGHAERLVS